MTDKINELLRRVEEFKPKAAAEIEEFRIKILGKKGELNALMEEFKTVAPELKRELGQQLNRLKNDGHASASTRCASSCRTQRPTMALAIGRPDPPRLGRAARFAPPDFAGEEPDRRGLLAAGLHRGRRTRNRGRLARLLGTQLPARTPGTRHAGHVLHREGPRHPAAHAHLVDPGPHDGAPETAHPRHLPRPRVPQRGHFVPRALHLPPDRRTLHRRRASRSPT